MADLVDVAAATAFLATARDPAVLLQTASVLGRDGPEADRLRARVGASPPIVRMFDRQRPDGSWGADGSASHRILSTLWPAKILAELGLTAAHQGLARALDFLEEHAIVDGGAGVNGRRDGVLPCYTGILGDTLLRAGRPDAAAAPLRWITTYQQVRYAGHDYLPAGRRTWDQDLTRRYGGCFAPGTTCLLGVVKGGLAVARAGSPDPAARVFLDAIRDLLSDRELFRRRDGGVIPLSAPDAAPPAARERWLAPAFPLTYQTDLLEIAQLAAEIGVPADRMAAALDRLAAWRLPDGTWPMMRRCSAPTWYQPEHPRDRTGSYWITLRVLRLWTTLRRAAPVPA
jgi:hypothetical protein